MSSTYQANRHDIGITNVGSDGSGTTVEGMMLAKTKDNVPAWTEFDGSYLADQFFTGAPSQSYINPEEEIIVGQDDWRSGFGLEFYDVNDPLRYYSSIGTDGRFRGMMIAGPTPVVATKPTHTTPTITNADFETDVSPTSGFGWTQGAGSWARVTDEKHGDSYSWKVTSVSPADNLYQDMTGYIPGIEYTFKLWVRTANAADTLKITINDGVGSTDSSTATSFETWTQFTVTRTLDVRATQCRLLVTCVAAGVGAAVWVDDAALTSTAIVVGTTPQHGHATFNDLEYVAFGTLLAHLNSGGTGFDLVADMGTAITCLTPFQVAGTSYLFIALGTGATWYYMTTAEAFTLSTTTVKAFQYAVWVNTTVDTMYANDGANTIRSTINPLNGGTAWSETATIVGAAEHNIQDLITKAGALYIPKEDTIYYLDSTGAVKKDLAPRLAALTSSTSGKNVITDGQIIMYPAGSQGLLEIDGTTLTWRNPSNYCTNLTAFVGRVQALGFDETYWFAIIDNDTKVEVLAGRLETIEGTTGWVWHPIAEITLTNCLTAWVSSVYQKRLWITSDTAAEDIYYIALPTGYGDMLNDANRKFKTATTFETPWLHGNFKSENKAWLTTTLSMGHVNDTGRYITVDYKKYNDTGWSNIGDFDGSATSMIETQYIDVTNKPFTPMMKFRFTMVTDDTDYTPVLNRFEARAIMYPSIRRMIHCVVRCAEEVQTKQSGIIDKNMYDTIKSTLDNARNNSVWPVSIRDLDGNAINVKFMPVPKEIDRMIITKKEQGREYEKHYHLLMLEVPLS